MTQKITQTRKNAFLAALRVSGNQTLSAERVRVSRSWVQLHRTRSPQFDAACRAAIRAAEAGVLRQAQDERPAGQAAGWRYADGVELVVRGTGGSEPVAARSPKERGRPQIARARVRQWSPRAEKRFLAALAATCNVKAACAEVGLSQASAYNHRRRWQAFAERWDEAIALGHSLLECALIEAACNLFSPDDAVAPGPVGVVREITADQAIHLLHMHKHRVLGLGKRPGRVPREPDIEVVRADVMRKLAALGRARALGLRRG